MSCDSNFPQIRAGGLRGVAYGQFKDWTVKIPPGSFHGFAKGQINSFVIKVADGCLEGKAKGYHANYIAADICGQESPSIPISIDCSLCTLGWPMRGGTVGLRVYGPRCDGPDQPPVDSYWIPSQGGIGLMFGVRCANPGDNREPNPGEWIFFGDIQGARTPGEVNDENYCQNNYRIRGRITATQSTGAPQVIISDTYIQSLDAAGAWHTYIQIPTQQLSEDANADTTPYRERRYISDYIPVTPALVGGEGDPISFMKLHLILQAFKYGCGGNETNIDPLCGMFRDGAWHTCFRAHIQNDIVDGYDAVIGDFEQLGFNPEPCGRQNERFCGCDVIERNQFGVFVAQNNRTQDFINLFANVGVPGETDANSIQQIQVGSGGTIAVKSVNGGPLYLVYRYSPTEVEVAPIGAPVQAHSPTIYKIELSRVKVWLYTMRFPSPSILPGECGGDDPPRTLMEVAAPSARESIEPEPQVSPDLKRIIQRISVPCVNLGDYLESLESCGCNKANVLRSCSLHGKCRVRGILKSADEVECLSCSDYQPRD